MLVGVPHAVSGLEAPDASPTLREMVQDVLDNGDIPVPGHVDFGHAGPNLPIAEAVRAGLDA